MWRFVVWRGEVGDVTADGVFERERERTKRKGEKRVRLRDMCEERENKKVFFWHFCPYRSKFGMVSILNCLIFRTSHVNIF